MNAYINYGSNNNGNNRSSSDIDRSMFVGFTLGNVKACLIHKLNIGAVAATAEENHLPHRSLLMSPILITHQLFLYREIPPRLGVVALAASLSQTIAFTS